MRRILKDLWLHLTGREWERTFPDPLIVCRHARKCAHVDGMLCQPKTCNTLRWSDEQWDGNTSVIAREAK